MVQAESFRFLRKPLEKENVSNALNAAINRLKKHESTYEYTYEFAQKKHIIDLKEVMYIYSQYRKVYIVFKNGDEVYFYNKLDTVECEIKEIYNVFARANKSYLVNINSIYTFNDKKVHMRNGVEITLSKKYENGLINRFFEEKSKKLK